MLRTLTLKSSPDLLCLVEDSRQDDTNRASRACRHADGCGITESGGRPAQAHPTAIA